MALLPCVLQSLFGLSQLPESGRFLSLCAQSKNVQEELLWSYLRSNRTTEFGKEHEFNEIATVEAYRKKVPIRSYQDFLPYIEAIRQGRNQVLTTEDVLHFHPTGGTTGTKLIPYTRTLKREFQRALAPWLVDVFKHFPGILSGKTYWTITPPGHRKPVLSDLTHPCPSQEGITHPQVQTGFEEDSSYFGWKGVFLERLFAVPSWVIHTESIEKFRLLTLFFLLRAKQLRWISIWSPTFFLVILEELTRNAELLLSWVYHGLPELPDSEELAIKLKPRPLKERSRELEKLLALPEEERYVRIWPDLQFISLWKDAYAAHSAQRLALFFPHTYFQGKGLLATEGVMSIPLCHASNNGLSGCVPAFTSHFMEFLSEDDGKTKCLWELQEGNTYSVILTTGGGLYRYDIGDLVTVEGLYRNLPLLRFLGRKGRFSDLVGEKLEEQFAAKCVDRTLQMCPISFSFLLLAPEEWEQTQGYVLFLESSQAPERLLDFAKQVEQSLCTNPQYEFAVCMGQITRLQVFLISHGGHKTYAQRCLDAGQKLGDIKPLSFDVRTGWKDIFIGAFFNREEPRRTAKEEKRG